MKICHLTTCHKFDDHRIFYKHSIPQTSFGYDVSISSFDNVTKPTSFYRENIYISILKSSRTFSILSRFIRAFRLFLFSLKSNADIFILHEPELLVFVPFMKIFKKTKVIYDIHEDYPVLVKSRLQNFKIRFLVEKFTSFYLKFTLLFVDSRIVVSQTIYDKFCSTGDIIFPNFSSPLAQTDLEKFRQLNPIKIIYAGVISSKKGAILLIDLAKKLNKQEFKFELHVCGSPIYCHKFSQTKFNDFINSDNVFFHGELSQRELHKLLAKTHIGLCFIEDNPHHNLSMPAKILDYISQRNFVIFSENLNLEEVCKSGLGQKCPNSCEELIKRIELLISKQLYFLQDRSNEKFLLDSILPKYKLYLQHLS
jgi:glycosyltransferase involved in cell wall biosynthesis